MAKLLYYEWHGIKNIIDNIINVIHDVLISFIMLLLSFINYLVPIYEWHIIDNVTNVM